MADSIKEKPRMLVIPQRVIERVGHFLLQNGRTSNYCMKQLTIAELRTALSRETGGRNRGWLLTRITKRIAALELVDKLLVVKKNSRWTGKPRGRLPKTVKELEMMANQIILGPDTPAAAQRLYEIRALLRKRKAEAEIAAIEKAAKQRGGVLTRAQERTLRRQIGDHTHAALALGEQCRICREVKSVGLADISCLSE